MSMLLTKPARSVLIVDAGRAVTARVRISVGAAMGTNQRDRLGGSTIPADAEAKSKRLASTSC